MLSLPVCGTAHQVFRRTCLSISSSRSRLRPKTKQASHRARKTTWICSDNACYPDKRYPFSDTSQVLSIRTVQSRRFTGNGGFLLLLRTLQSGENTLCVRRACAREQLVSQFPAFVVECFAGLPLLPALRMPTWTDWSRRDRTAPAPCRPCLPSRRIRRLRYRSHSLLWPSWRSGAARPDAADGTGRKSSLMRFHRAEY